MDGYELRFISPSVVGLTNWVFVPGFDAKHDWSITWLKQLGKSQTAINNTIGLLISVWEIIGKALIKPQSNFIETNLHSRCE